MKSLPRFVALLRGINVGGKKVIAKEDQRRCFAQLGFVNVRTYIQSGNILFQSKETNVKSLTTAVESGLSARFSYPAQAVLSLRKFKAAVAAAPSDWGTDDEQKHNALFTLGGITPKRFLTQLAAPKSDIGTVNTGPGVIFWSVSKRSLTRTTWMKLAQQPAYQHVKVRNHSTVFKLLELIDLS